MILWPGVRLCAVLDGLSKEGIYNSQLLRVVSWGSGKIELVCVEGGQTHRVTLAFCQLNLRLAFFMTYASVQGRTVVGTLALHDTKHHHFSRRHLVMGLTRATAVDLVWLMDYPPLTSISTGMSFASGREHSYRFIHSYNSYNSYNLNKF